MYFFGEHIDILSQGKRDLLRELREENWKSLEPEKRLDILQVCETRIAAFEGRSACTVKAAPLEKDENARYYLGQQRIEISSSMLEKDASPYAAFKALAEESHHAFQDYALKNPGFHKGLELEDWRENHKNYDVNPDISYRGYISQPIEWTARSAASSATKALRHEHDMQRAGEWLKSQTSEPNSGSGSGNAQSISKEAISEKTEQNLAKIIGFEQQSGKDPTATVQFGDGKIRRFAIKELEPGDDLKGTQIPDNLAKRLQNMKQGESEKAELDRNQLNEVGAQKLKESYSQHSRQREQPANEAQKNEEAKQQNIQKQDQPQINRQREQEHDRER